MPPAPMRSKEEYWNKFRNDVDSKMKQAVLKFKAAQLSMKRDADDKLLNIRKSKALLLDKRIAEYTNLKAREKMLELDLNIKANEQLSLKHSIEEAKNNSVVHEGELATLREKIKLRDEETEKKQREAKLVFDAHVRAMSYYKKHLPCYIDFEEVDKEIFTFKFLNSAETSLPRNCFVKLSYRSSKWELLMMQPTLPCHNNLCARLRETGDILGFIAHIYKLLKSFQE